MGTSGDKIVLLDGMGSGSGSATNGLLSMIPGMFTSLMDGVKHFMEVITDVGATMDAATTETLLFNSIKEGGYYGLCF